MEHDEVHDHSSFAQYVTQLRAELDDPSRQSDWENVDLREFLSAMAAWATDWDTPADENPWRHAAGVLAAASVYE
ncbi:DUF7660 family protein [Sphingobium sp. C100]|uniref:DUF7660 family protein n=1 Tax=Sphingobium sp. C100 TaxID=1207055 RepID=UPI001267A7CF